MAARADVEAALTSAAHAIAEHQTATALDLLLDVFAVCRSHELLVPIEACAARMSCWRRLPVIVGASEGNTWLAEAVRCHPADLGALIAAMPDVRLDVIARDLAPNRRPDPRIGGLLLALVRDEDRRHLVREQNWSYVFTALARHSDVFGLDELARVGPSLAHSYQRLEPSEKPPAFTERERTALDRVDRALEDTPTNRAIEVIGAIDPRVATDVHAIAIGAGEALDRAIAALRACSREHFGLAAPSLVRILDVPAHPSRLAIVQLLAERWGERDFFDTAYADDELANFVRRPWPTYLRLIDDDSVPLQVATLVLLAHLDLSCHNMYEQYRSRADRAAPAVRAAFVVAAGRAYVHTRRSYEHAEWPLDADVPLVRFAAAMGELLDRGQRISGEALSLLEAPPANADPALFPWFGGDCAAMAAAALRHVALPAIASELEAIEQAIRSGAWIHDDWKPEWPGRAWNLVPRVFGHRFECRYAHERATLPRDVALTDDQRRLLAILTYGHSHALERLRVRPLDAGEVRRVLRLGGRAVHLPPSKPFESWTFDDEARLANCYGGHATDVPGIAYDAVQGRTFVVSIEEDVSECAGVLDGCGAVALRGGDATAKWLASGERCDSLRILDLWSRPPPDVQAAIARSPVLRGLRWLHLSGDLGAVLASPLLTELELLDCGALDDAKLLRSFTKLRSLTISSYWLGLDGLAQALRELHSPLERLVIQGVAPIDAIAQNPAFRIDELVVTRATLHGADRLGQLSTLRVLTASQSSLDDAGAERLAACATLERADLSGTDIGDSGAHALAAGSLSSLAMLDLSETHVRDLDAIARLSELPAMATLRLPFRARVELWLANRVLRAVEPISDRELHEYTPHPRTTPGDWLDGLARDPDVAVVVAHARAQGRWPEPPPGATRRFVYSVDRECETCGGSGRCSDGPCPYHSNMIEIRHDGELPYDPSHARAFASAFQTIARAEEYAAALARLLAGTSVAPTISWRFDCNDRERVPDPPSHFDQVSQRKARLITSLWPIERHFETPAEPAYAIALEIFDLGFSIVHVADANIHVGFHQ